MKKIVYLLFVFTVFFLSFSFVSHAMESKYLDIGLTHSIVSPSKVSLQSRNGFSVFSVNGVYLGNISEENITVEFRDSIFRIFGDFNREYSEYSANQLMFSNALSEGETISVGKYSYRGFIKFIFFKDNPVVVNRIHIEEYLRGVVPSEMSPSFPIEALKAQAICSRSFAYANINKMASKGYNLDDTSVCQVYFGTMKEDSRTDIAVRETAGTVALYEGKVANTIFYSQSYGWTENSSDIWGGGQPYLTSVFDPYGGSDETKWRYEISRKDLEHLLIKKGHDIGSLLEVRLGIRSTTGSVSNLEFIGTRGSILMKSSIFRTLIGSTKLKSTFFRWKQEDLWESRSSETYSSPGNDFYATDFLNRGKLLHDNVYVLDTDGNISKKRMDNLSILSSQKEKKNVTSDFSITQPVSATVVFFGKGYGHGVGMPQLSAKKMAEKGKLAKEIISFFYKGVIVATR